MKKSQTKSLPASLPIPNMDDLPDLKTKDLSSLSQEYPQFKDGIRILQSAVEASRSESFEDREQT